MGASSGGEFCLPETFSGPSDKPRTRFTVLIRWDEARCLLAGRRRRFSLRIVSCRGVKRHQSGCSRLDGMSMLCFNTSRLCFSTIRKFHRKNLPLTAIAFREIPEGISEFKASKLQRHCVAGPIKADESTIGNLRVHKTSGPISYLTDTRKSLQHVRRFVRDFPIPACK